MLLSVVGRRWELLTWKRLWYGADKGHAWNPSIYDMENWKTAAVQKVGRNIRLVFWSCHIGHRLTKWIILAFISFYFPNMRTLPIVLFSLQCWNAMDPWDSLIFASFLWLVNFVEGMELLLGVKVTYIFLSFIRSCVVIVVSIKWHSTSWQ